MLRKFVWVIMMLMVAGCSNSTFNGPTDAEISTLDPEERILLAVNTGDIESLEEALQTYPDLLVSMSSTGNTLLHHAVMVAQLDSVRFLLDKGADPNAINVNNDTPLDVAREMGAGSEVSELLRSAGGH